MQNTSTTGTRKPVAAKFTVEASDGPFTTVMNLGVGKTLSQVRNHYGTDEFKVRNPVTGALETISLKQWAHADPDATYIRISLKVTY